MFQPPAYASPEEAEDSVARIRKYQKLSTTGGPITLAQAWKLECDDMSAIDVREATGRFAEDNYRALPRA